MRLRRANTRALVIDKKPLPATVFNSANKDAKTYINRMQSAFRTGAIHDYNIITTAYTKYFGGSSKVAAAKRSSVQDSSSPAKGKSGDKQQKHKPTNDNSSNNSNHIEDKTGVFKFTGNGKPPIPDISFPHPRVRNKQSTLCMNFAIEGKSCRFGKRCNLYHLVRVSDVPAAQRPTLLTWVDDTTDITWCANALSNLNTNQG